jgi:hypothetical protein
MRAMIWLSLLVGGLFAEPYLSNPLSDMSHKTCEFACYTGHKGTDYQQYEGAPIYAAHDGYVTAHLQVAGNKGGNYVVLDDESGHKTRYLHLKDFGPGIQAEKKVWVSRGQMIGRMGNSGGPWLQGYDDVGNPIERSPVHLHFEAYLKGVAVDPYSESSYLWLNGLPIVPSFRMDFDFASVTQQYDSQGFRYGFNASFAALVPIEKGSLQVKVLGANPGVESPAFVFCPLASRTKIHYSVKVYNKTISQVESESMVWARDQRGRWDNSVRPVRLTSNSSVSGQGDYEEWQVDLSKLSIECLDNQVSNGLLKVKQFSLEPTESGASAYWTIDWVRVDCGLFAAETFEDWKLFGGADLERSFLRWKIDPTADPQLVTPPLNGFDIGSGVQIQILFSLGGKGGGKQFDLGQVYWKNYPSEAYSGTKRSVFINIADGTKTVVSDGLTHLATADIGAMGKIYEMRIDPINDGESGSADSIIVKSVAVVRLGDPGWVFVSSKAVEVIRQGVFLAESHERILSYQSDTPTVVPSLDFPFQFGFRPVDYGDFTFNGLVFGLSRRAGGSCWDVLDTGSVFAPNGPNIWCVMEMADISGTFQCNMVFYRNGAYWWQTGYGQTSNTGGNVWPCAAMPIEADCFKESGQYQVEARIKHDGKEYSLVKRDLTVSGTNAVSSINKPLARAGPKSAFRRFDIRGRALVIGAKRPGVVIVRSLDKTAAAKAIVSVK